MSEALFDMSKRDEALMQLYAILTRRSEPKPGSFSALSTDGRRQYMREAKQRSRARIRAASDLVANRANVRDALADAALMILAIGAPGADQVREVLARAFPHMPGLPLTIGSQATSGALRPKLFGDNRHDR